ncbi:MAG: helix-turn-helix transcriptional regulator [Christiangramia sp.]|uniref:AraC family transcriptional regulator n=1 Tax=Christiangramia TaxID=292691 RepID=UPI0009FAAFFE|nr:AraC family transcriptional regulator [Christiangramia flava]OSS38403.1 AraC family transcriptional regulator protein [Christiangramia flava JLT2011]
MNVYRLELNDVDDFVPELAEQLEIGYQNELGEFSLQIPASLGNGHVYGINFPNGIGLYTYKCSFKEKTQFRICHPVVKPLRILYLLSGELTSQFHNSEHVQKLKHHQHLIAAPLDQETHIINFPANTEVNLTYLEVDRLKFQQYLSFDLHELEPVYYRIFNDVKAERRICQVGKFNMQTSEVLKKIKSSELEGFPRVTYLGGKTLEILSYMLYRFKKEDHEFFSNNIREKDLEAIEKAAKHIEENIAMAATVHDVAKVAGVNTNKLQTGFQALYGKTVNEYIRDVRLSKALNMLSSGRKNVSEVVYELGLSSRSYFSKIFKEKYGISPRKLLNGAQIQEIPSD